MAGLLPSPTHAHTNIPAPYLLNPFIAMSSANPFTLFPDAPASVEAIKKTENFKYYISKIDDIIEIIELGRIHIFKGLVASRLFDLTSVSSKGETVASALAKKGAEKAAYTLALAENGVDPRTLAPSTFWEKDLTEDQLAALYEHFQKFEQAKRVEALAVQALSAPQMHFKTQAKALCDKITPHVPYINMERILGAAFSNNNIRIAISLLSLGACADHCPSVLPFAHFLYRSAAPEEAKVVFATKAPPARFPAVSFDHTRVEGPGEALSRSMDSLGATGLSEMFFRSQLAAVWGIHDWGSTIDHFPKPDAALFPADIHTFFDFISVVDGYANNPIIITDKDLSYIEKKWELIQEEPHRPIVIASGWRGHSCVVVIERGPAGAFLYLGNRAPQSLEIDIGVYKYQIDPSKITKCLITKLIINESNEWLENFEKPDSLAKEVGSTSREVFASLPPQCHPNCTWTSTAELACYILQRSIGASHGDAYAFMKNIRIKARREFLFRYLKMDRTINPHLHSPVLLAAILAKSIVRMEEKKGEIPIAYFQCINYILTSGLSVDVMQLVYTLASKFHLSVSVTTALKDLATLLHTDIEGVIHRLDPIYRPGESVLRRLRSDQAKIDTTPLVFDSNFHAIDWLEEGDIPVDYKVAIVQNLIPPFYAFVILSAPGIALPAEVKEKLQEKVQKAGLPTTTYYLETFGAGPSNIDYTDPDALNTYLQHLAEEEHRYSTLLLNADTTAEISAFYCYLSFVLQDPHAGVPLAALLLQRKREDLARLYDYYPKKESFPEEILSRSHTKFLENIDGLIAGPGWPAKSKINTVMNILRKEPFEKQIQFALTFLQTLDNKLDEHEVADPFLEVLWEENPCIAQEILNRWLERAESREELYFSSVFPLLVDLLWANDQHFMQIVLGRDLQNVILWPSDIQAIIQIYFVPNLSTNDMNLPNNIPESLIALEVDPEDWTTLQQFFTENRIPPFNKRKRTDDEESSLPPAHKPFRV